jgi:undecaprenyl pyrophosphate phosphatase UppP
MTVRARWWIETIVAVVCGILAVVTLFWRDWLEVTGWDPDNHSGSAEWLIIAALAIVAIVVGALARRERHRLIFDA